MIDNIVYTALGAEVLESIKGRTDVQSNGEHAVTLVRTRTEFEAPAGVEVLATGHCKDDCPFDKLAGEALEKYKLAYDTEPFAVIDPDTEEETMITPPFKFGSFL